MAQQHRDEPRYQMTTVEDGRKLLFDDDVEDAWILSTYTVEIGNAPK